MSFLRTVDDYLDDDNATSSRNSSFVRSSASTAPVGSKTPQSEAQQHVTSTDIDSGQRSPNNKSKSSSSFTQSTNSNGSVFSAQSGSRGTSSMRPLTPSATSLVGVDPVTAATRLGSTPRRTLYHDPAPAAETLKIQLDGMNQERKGGELHSAATSSRTAASISSSGAKKKKAASQQSWCCAVCSNLNYAHRDRCHMSVCRAPRGFPGPYKEPVLDSNRLNLPMGQTVWTCPRCDATNRATRSVCHNLECRVRRVLEADGTTNFEILSEEDFKELYELEIRATRSPAAVSRSRKETEVQCCLIPAPPLELLEPAHGNSHGPNVTGRTQAAEAEEEIPCMDSKLSAGATAFVSSNTSSNFLRSIDSAEGDDDIEMDIPMGSAHPSPPRAGGSRFGKAMAASTSVLGNRPAASGPGKNAGPVRSTAFGGEKPISSTAFGSKSRSAQASANPTPTNTSLEASSRTHRATTPLGELEGDFPDTITSVLEVPPPLSVDDAPIDEGRTTNSTAPPPPPPVPLASIDSMLGSSSTVPPQTSRHQPTPPATPNAAMPHAPLPVAPAPAVEATGSNTPPSGPQTAIPSLFDVAPPVFAVPHHMQSLSDTSFVTNPSSVSSVSLSSMQHVSPAPGGDGAASQQLPLLTANAPPLYVSTSANPQALMGHSTSTSCGTSTSTAVAPTLQCAPVTVAQPQPQLAYVVPQSSMTSHGSTTSSVGSGVPTVVYVAAPPAPAPGHPSHTSSGTAGYGAGVPMMPLQPQRVAPTAPPPPQ